MRKARIVFLVLLVGLASCDAFEDAEEAAGAATETAEGFLTLMKDKDYDAAIQLTINPARSYLDGADEIDVPTSWAAEWTKIRGGGPSWKQDGWGAKSGNLYFVSSELQDIQDRHKWELQQRDEYFVILAYTLEYDGQSDTSLDFVVLPTDEGWRISEIWFYS